MGVGCAGSHPWPQDQVSPFSHHRSPPHGSQPPTHTLAVCGTLLGLSPTSHQSSILRGPRAELSHKPAPPAGKIRRLGPGAASGRVPQRKVGLALGAAADSPPLSAPLSCSPSHAFPSLLDFKSRPFLPHSLSSPSLSLPLSPSIDFSLLFFKVI